MSDLENIPQIKPDINDSFLGSENKVDENVRSASRIESNSWGESTEKEKQVTKKIPMIGKKRKKIILAILGVSALVFLFLVGISIMLFQKAKILNSEANNLMAAAKEQDLDKIKSELDKTEDKLKDFQKTYRLISWTKYTPFVGFYVRDGEHFIKAGELGIEAAKLGLTAIEPYADIVGLKDGNSQQAGSGEETAQERIDFIVKSLPELTPKVDEIIGKVTEIKKELADVNPNKYPEKLAGKNIRGPMKSGFDLFNQVSTLVISSKPMLENSNYMLGVDEPRTYMILFQNDKEIRPTGGFITAYSIAKVDNGKFIPVSSDDIYNLDSHYTPSVEAPEPIVKYLKGPYVLSAKYRLRDMNWSPDFEKSMGLFITEAKKAGIGDIDGIIAVDTQMLVNLLNVIGPVGVPGFGNYSTEIVPECNCSQVIYELENFADVEGPIVWSENEPGKIVYAPPNYDDRKKIIGPLMNSILANTLGQSKEKLPALFEAGLKSLTEKHILLYMLDEKSQSAASEFGIAGKIKDYEGDYLYVNDANLGGRKSNLYTTQEVSQEINIKSGGTVEKTVTITYKNPEKQDGWLNSILPNWVRVYVPKGSELISFDGLEDKQDPYEEFGKTVFAGYFELRPQGVVKLTIKYILPFKTDSREYKIFLQKQPGTDSPLYSVSIGKKSEEFYLRADKELTERL